MVGNSGGGLQTSNWSAGQREGCIVKPLEEPRGGLLPRLRPPRPATGSSPIRPRVCSSASILLPVASPCISRSDPHFNLKLAALHRSSPSSPEPPSDGDSVAVDVVLPVGRVHHPPTRKKTLKLLVPSVSPNSPWFDAGVHRRLRAPASLFKPDMRAPRVSLCSFSPNRFLLTPSGKIRLLSCA